MRSGTLRSVCDHPNGRMSAQVVHDAIDILVLASCLHRPSYAKVRSTTYWRGRRTKPCSFHNLMNMDFAASPGDGMDRELPGHGFRGRYAAALYKNVRPHSSFRRHSHYINPADFRYGCGTRAGGRSQATLRMPLLRSRLRATRMPRPYVRGGHVTHLNKDDCEIVYAPVERHRELFC